MDRRLPERLDAWVEAGLISGDQATAIVEHETRPGRAAGRSGAAEAVGYVGAALAVAALLLFVGEQWDLIPVPGRLALTVLLATALLVAGGVLRSSPSASIERLVSVLWLVGTAGTGWVAWVVAGDLLDLREADLALAVTGALALVGGTLHGLRPRTLSQLTVLAGVAGVALSLLDRPVLEVEPAWWGLTLFALGAAWALAGAGGWLHPRTVAESAGVTMALIGAQVGSFGEARIALLVLGVVAAGLLVGAAVVREGVHLLAVGALGLFVLVPQLVFELFGDAIGAPATLLVVGLLLVALSVGLGRVRREVGRRG